MDTSEERWKQAQSAEAEHTHFERSGKAELERLRSHLDICSSFFAGSWVLEVGAGNGPVYAIAEADTRVGIDPLSNNSETLSRITLYDRNNVTTGVGEALPFENDAFDIIICNNVLDHVQSVDETLEQIRRVLKPDGHFLLRVHAFSTLESLPASVRRLVNIFDRPHPHHFTPREVKDLVVKNGFDIESTHNKIKSRFSGHSLKFKIATGFFGFTEVGLVAQPSER